MMYVLNFFDPTASATAYGQRPKFAMAKHSATAKGENCTYGPTLVVVSIVIWVMEFAVWGEKRICTYAIVKSWAEARLD